MCGILGWVNNKKRILNQKNLFINMLDTMSNRGNDNTGYYFKDNILLGHKRLAIIDLENGNQPFFYKNYCIVYNGEIYNADEIKLDLIERGYEFDTTCDTEVLFKAYIEYKEKCLDLLEGIFSFAVYDEDKKSLFIARDRYGVKPLYYLKYKNNLIFSSTIKAILTSNLIKPIIGKKELTEILSLGPSKCVGSGVFRGINELRAGHYLIYKKNKIKIRRYYNIKTAACNDTYDDAREKIKTLLTDSIKRQMRSDVDIACLLSGGLDSSIITAVVAQNLNKQLTTYSIDYVDNDKYFKKTSFTVDLDKKFIEDMSEKYNTNHIYKVITQEDLAKALEYAVDARDYPGMADVDSSLLWFSKEISKDFKVILSGECADEIFGGYPWFYRDELNDRESFPWINNLDYRQSLLNSKYKKRLNLKKFAKKEYNKMIKELPKGDRKNKYKKLFYVNMTHFMTTLLDRKDRMTMYSTLEARVPFADTELINYLWNLPFDYKYRFNQEKYILRDAFKDILPESISKRKKNPYPKTHNPIYLKLVSNLLKKSLQDKNSVLYKVFDIDKINELLNAKDDDLLPWFGQLMTKPQLIAYLYQFDYWFKKYNIELK